MTDKKSMENDNENTINIIDKDENSKSLDNKNTNHDDDIQEFMKELRPLYPPLIITPELLMPKLPSVSASSSSSKLSKGSNNKKRKEQSIKFPNAFIAYRMEFCKQLKNKRICLTMQDVSYFASKLWKKEPCDVKKTYTKLANDAKLLYEKRKKELLLVQEQREQRQQIENENIILQQQQQSSSMDISSLCSLNPSLFQENKDTQQIFPVSQHHFTETATILSQPQISFSSPAIINSTQFLYDFPAVDSHITIPYEDYNIQPYINYGGIPDLNHRMIWNLLTSIEN
jgi:hypothetical protein